jgi:hypothetical protein
MPSAAPAPTFVCRSAHSIIRTPQQGAKQFGFRLAPNDFDHNQFVHATTLSGEADSLSQAETEDVSETATDRRAASVASRALR